VKCIEAERSVNIFKPEIDDCELRPTQAASVFVRWEQSTFGTCEFGGFA
jgi:hypothetical protein